MITFSFKIMRKLYNIDSSILDTFKNDKKNVAVIFYLKN